MWRYTNKTELNWIELPKRHRLTFLTLLFFLSGRVAASTSRESKRSRLQPRPSPARPSTSPHRSQQRAAAPRPAPLPPTAALLPGRPRRASFHWVRHRLAHHQGSPARRPRAPRPACDPESNRENPSLTPAKKLSCYRLNAFLLKVPVFAAKDSPAMLYCSPMILLLE